MKTNKKKTKTFFAEISAKPNDFGVRFLSNKKSHDYSDTTLIRQLFSKEKSRIIHTIKTKNPSSIYSLAKLLQRDLKSVRNDLKLLRRFGLIDFHLNKKGKKQSLKPVLCADKIEIILNI